MLHECGAPGTAGMAWPNLFPHLPLQIALFVNLGYQILE
jgi:hypothetical protein